LSRRASDRGREREGERETGRERGRKRGRERECLNESAILISLYFFCADAAKMKANWSTT
jgi:hypothetical protein